MPRITFTLVLDSDTMSEAEMRSAMVDHLDLHEESIADEFDCPLSELKVEMEISYEDPQSGKGHEWMFDVRPIDEESGETPGSKVSILQEAINALPARD